MRLLSRTLFREIFTSAVLGSLLFTLVLFLDLSQKLFEFLVRDSGQPRLVAYLFALLLPAALPITIPLGVLVGTLITLSRKSADGEIIAMRAAGVSGRRVAPPVLAFGFLGMCVALAASLWLTPWSIRKRYTVQNQLLSQVTTEVRPRLFESQFPNTILYVNDVLTANGTTARWKRIFLADITPSAERHDIPIVTLAQEATAAPDTANNRIQLTLQRMSSYEAADKYNISGSPAHDQVLAAPPPSEVAPYSAATSMDTLPLYRYAYDSPGVEPDKILDARIEFHRRLAVPFACMLLALTGIPLGAGSRRSGNSMAVVLTVALAFLYYMCQVGMLRLAQKGSVSPGPAMWAPDVLFLILGVTMMARLESPGDRDYIGKLAGLFRSVGRAPREHMPRLLDRVQSRLWFPMLPQVVDGYLVTSFLFYFLLWLASFVLMTHVFTFFDLLSDILKNNISLTRVAAYFFFLTPRYIYNFTPISVLTAVLVVFGVLSKNNEVTAFKACGVSVFRLAVPILASSLLLSGSLFAFDHYWVPGADRQQEAIHAEIKGKPPQTFLDPERKWMYGLHDRIYYYKYFDQAEQQFLGLNIFEIDPGPFLLKRQIVAERARWDPILHSWVLQNGWSRDITGDNSHVENFDARPFPDLEETPEYFVKEKIESSQMNFLELDAYIRELRQSGFDTIKLQVEFYKKFSVPLVALILAMVSVPFAFQAGNRGAMAGVGISFVIYVAYFSVQRISEQVGNLSQLSPTMAAWSPDIVFALVGLYFLVRMRS
jgi:LPS export ABC transporter permease LptG/LPS export ABC transporter permease LptF